MAGDVIDLITQDHREVERLCDELRRHPDKRPSLTPLLATLLTAHSRAEEAEVYPVAGRPAPDRAGADRLLSRLDEADPRTRAYDEVLARLVGAVTEHVREEETAVLPELRDRFDGQRRAELGVAFLRNRGEYLNRQLAPGR